MNRRAINQCVLFAVILCCSAIPLRAEDFTNAIRAILQHRVDIERKGVGIVVGLVDEHGSTTVSYGKMGGGTAREVNGDTIFEIGSVTKTFTGLLLQLMVDRGEIKMDDPVAIYLPDSVKMPTRKGKQITLLHLATHTSGLPFEPDNFNPKRAANPRADYGVENLYNFLSTCELTRDPGAKYEYSSLGYGLLGHVLARKAGTNYESLVENRICRPLKMDSTCINLTPELKNRLAQGHNEFGYPVSNWEYLVLSGCGALRSTANDQLKYISANLGLIPSSLTPVMEKTHLSHFQSSPISHNGVGWFVRDAHQFQIVLHDGGTGGFSSFVGFDKSRRRGVVVLSNFLEDVNDLGFLLLESEWQSNRRPITAGAFPPRIDSYVGQYKLLPNLTLGMRTIRALLFHAPRASLYAACGCFLAAFLILFKRARSIRRRWSIFGSATLVVCILPILSLYLAAWVVCARSQPGISIRREGDRIFADYTFTQQWPRILKGLRPQISGYAIGEILPETESQFFERLTGNPFRFSRDAQRKPTRVTIHDTGAAFCYEKISDQPAKIPDPPQQRVEITLDPKLLNAFVGRYEFAPNPVFPQAGMKVTIQREGNQLFWQAWGRDTIQGAIEIYPESESTFFLKINNAQLTFIRNAQGEVTEVIHHQDELPDIKGKKLLSE